MSIPTQREATDGLDTGTKVEAVDDGSSRWYQHPETGDQYLSVTHITGRCVGKPWLAPWAAGLAAEYAVDQLHSWHATFRDDGRDAAIKQIKTYAAAQRDLKADVGVYTHDVIEALILDAPLPGIPDHLAGRVVDMDGERQSIDQEWLDGIVDGFLAFVHDFDAEPIAAECVAASDEHRAAGTIDGIYRLAGRTILVDTKTGAHLGGEMLAQLGAYHAFPHLWLRNGRIVHKPEVDGCAVLHLRASYSRGYKLLAVTPEELAVGWAWWQDCRRQVEQSEQVPDRFGRAFYPPLPDGSQPPPMVEDLRSYAGCSRAVRPLVGAGLVWLSDVAELDRADVLAISGVGPKTVDALVRVLTENGLTFRGESLQGVA